MVTVPTFIRKSQYRYLEPRHSTLCALAFWKWLFSFNMRTSKFPSAVRQGPPSNKAWQLNGVSELCITYSSLVGCPEKQHKTHVIRVQCKSMDYRIKHTNYVGRIHMPLLVYFERKKTLTLTRHLYFSTYVIWDKCIS